MNIFTVLYISDIINAIKNIFNIKDNIKLNNSPNSEITLSPNNINRPKKYKTIKKFVNKKVMKKVPLSSIQSNLQQDLTNSENDQNTSDLDSQSDINDDTQNISQELLIKPKLTSPTLPIRSEVNNTKTETAAATLFGLIPNLNLNNTRSVTVAPTLFGLIPTSEVNNIRSGIPLTTSEINNIKAEAALLTSTINNINTVKPLTTSEINNIKAETELLISAINNINATTPLTTSEINNIKLGTELLTSAINNIKAGIPLTISEINNIKTGTALLTSAINNINTTTPLTSSNLPKLDEINNIKAELTSSFASEINNIKAGLTSSFASEINNIKAGITSLTSEVNNISQITSPNILSSNISLSESGGLIRGMVPSDINSILQKYNTNNPESYNIQSSIDKELSPEQQINNILQTYMTNGPQTTNIEEDNSKINKNKCSTVKDIYLAQIITNVTPSFTIINDTIHINNNNYLQFDNKSFKSCLSIIIENNIKSSFKMLYYYTGDKPGFILNAYNNSAFVINSNTWYDILYDSSINSFKVVNMYK
jgi:hypothetical protein